ncbi:uncharacterized protein HMPREF1541_01394 [Cyphellophora europaea CBS 101466]|uniref:Major facilitator superfamily (MFS) profile domain-containing protein n=1 Tax=Cyphellophora europaea (strain CBS 101466) TaxID=1220924 RepID=W2SGS0_CYPE1|nr:uncharacterized protein HMPREF1541_01394 [Cyphellophora europaea CBS 101466]ETN47203.1 hypothetical protein HMPREF1541_01394 [Cyphellophora europaea CBS 101466]
MVDNSKPPIGLRWRSNTIFILATISIGLFTDLFLYGLIVPVMPFILRDRVGVPPEYIQSYVSGMLAAFAGSSFIFSVPAGWVADRMNARQVPYLAGLAALLGATVLLAVGRSVAVLVFARVLQGLSGAVVWSVGLAMVMETVGPSNMGKAVGTIFPFISVGELAAPVLGGVLYEKTGYTGIFMLASAFLAVDFVLRLLVIEKKVAARYEDSQEEAVRTAENQGEHRAGEEEEGDEAGEEDSLLQKETQERYIIPDGQNRIVRAAPILYCLSDPRLLVAFFLSFVQAALLGTFDATIPTEADKLFHFDSLKVGLLFVPEILPSLVLGPVAGWSVDRYGTKPASVLGCAYLVPALALLRLPSDGVVKDPHQDVILYCGLLAVVGAGVAIIGSPPLVEAGHVVQRYHKANPDFFGDHGPYAQLYGFNSLVFCAGLTVGPMVSGSLRDAIGYGHMNAVLAGLLLVTAILSFVYVGGTPKLLSKKWR